MLYAISYDKVKQYKQSVLKDENHKLDQIEDGTTHNVVDNVDHNTDSAWQRYLPWDGHY